MILRKGDFGGNVKTLQMKLQKLGYYTYKIDSDFGVRTENAVKAFQKNARLTIDGIAGPNTLAHIDKRIKPQKFDKNMFIVAIDAGHGSIHPITGRYTTNGKYFYHGDKDIHIGDGYFYEGYENRIIAEMAIELLQKHKIPVIRLYHAYEDTPLQDRTSIIKSLEKVGYYGWMHSIHSNAISTTYPKEKLNSTQGGIIFTSKGQNFSDVAGKTLYKYWLEAFGDKLRHNGKKWLWGIDSDGDADREANFYMLRNTENKFIETQFKGFASTLSEFGFFTSYFDTKFITQQQIRFQRAYAILKTAIDMRKQFKEMHL